MISRWGRPWPSALRRIGSPDVHVLACLLQYSPVERMGQMVNPLDRKALIASIDLDGNQILEPDPAKDRLVTFKVDPTTGLAIQPLVVDENLTIVMTPGRIEMIGLVVFWRLQVRR